MEPMRRGLMLVLSSPSGAGKTTIASHLLKQDCCLELSVSYTTRRRRKGEKEGKDYHFVDVGTFMKMRDNGEFLEWAVVFDNYYGTPKKPVERALAQGRDVLFDVDWQGARELKKSAKKDVVAVFILPPTAAALENRLRLRAKDSNDVMLNRMRGASREIKHWRDYSYVVVNSDIQSSVEAVRAILVAERLHRSRFTGLKDFVQNLLAEL